VIATAPTVEPLSFADVQAQCRVDSTDEQTIVESYVKSARQVFEELGDTKLINQTWDVYYNDFHEPLEMPWSPMVSISSIKYQDVSNTQQTLSAEVYEAGERNQKSLVRLKYNQTWPTTIGHPDSVVVRAVFGYGTAGTNVPSPVLQVLRWLVGHQYMHREPLLVGTISKELEWTIANFAAPYMFREF